MFIQQTKLGKSYKHIIRYKQIISVLIKHGYQDFVQNSKLLSKLNIKSHAYQAAPAQAEISKQGHWERIRHILEELGTTYIKLGQFVSNRPDLIPKDLCSELEKLLDHVPPFDGDTALSIVEDELGTSSENIFQEFNKKPFSAASISQVHEGTLLDGRQVAVKIQRPGIKKTIETDLEIMLNLAELIKKHVQGADVLNPVGIVEEFSDGIRHELDFENEALNIDKFSSLFKNKSSLKVFDIYKEYSTKKILTMEFVKGTKLNDYILSSPEKSDAKLISDNLADVVLSQIFEFGYFHADPHPANLIVCDDKKICFIDCGLMGMLPPKHKNALSEIIIGLVDHDPERISKAVTKISLTKDIENKQLLENDVYRIIEKYAYLPLKEINIGYFLRDLINTIIQNKIYLPSDIYLLLKSLISLEGSVRKLYPEFDMLSHVEPFVRQIIYEKTSPLQFLKDIYKSSLDYTRLFCELPSEIRDILEQVKNKTIKIQFEHKGLEPVLSKLDQVTNRIAYSIITASMLLGSSIIIHAKIPPLIYNISGIGMLIFLFALLMGCLLLTAIIKHGRL